MLHRQQTIPEVSILNKVKYITSTHTCTRVNWSYTHIVHVDIPVTATFAIPSLPLVTAPPLLTRRPLSSSFFPFLPGAMLMNGMI